MATRKSGRLFKADVFIVGLSLLGATAACAATPPSFVTSDAVFWLDASALTDPPRTSAHESSSVPAVSVSAELDSWADVRGGSYPTFTTYTTTKPQVIEISRPLCVGPIGTR